MFSVAKRVMGEDIAEESETITIGCTQTYKYVVVRFSSGGQCLDKIWKFLLISTFIGDLN